MKPIRLLDIISIDEFSASPKHIQLAQGILKAIENGFVKNNDIVPSLNELKDTFEISRDTAEKCYKYLRHLGVLESVPGKGYYIRNAGFRHSLKICLLFNKLSVHKQIIYNSFVQVIGEQASIDFYVYNNDIRIFRKLLSTKKEPYSHYVIIPHFFENSDDVHDILNTIPKNKLILLDKKVPGVKGQFALIYENFEKDIYTALKACIEQLSKYHTIKIVFPKHSYYPKDIVIGASKFCQDFAFTCKVVHNISAEQVHEGEVFICLMEDDLVTLVEKVIQVNLCVGKQVGVISYNETPLKKIILDGITTISTDFALMGALAAKMVLEKKKDVVELPFYLTLRASL
jgi:DNA-binding transcriptional regulator YhcF (GntR family)